MILKEEDKISKKLNVSIFQYARVTKLTSNILRRIKERTQELIMECSQLDIIKKKINKEKSQERKQEPLSRLYNYNFLSNKEQNIIQKRKISRLEQSFLPTYVKVMDNFSTVLNIQNSFLYTKNKKGWILQVKNNLKRKTQPNEEVIGFQEICFHQLSLVKFQKIFEKRLKNLTNNQIKILFNTLKSKQCENVFWPTLTLQPLSCKKFNDFIQLTKKEVVDDKDVINFSVALSQVDTKQDIGQQMKSESSEIQLEQTQKIALQAGELLVWYMGTNIYRIVNLYELTHFNQVDWFIIEDIFTHTRLSKIKEEVDTLIKNYNTAMESFNEVQLEPEQKQMFIHRIIKGRKEKQNELYLVLKYRWNSVNRQHEILVRSLKTNKIGWDVINRYKISYTLPQLKSSQLIYLYLLDTQEESIRQQYALRLLISEYHSIPISQESIFQQAYPPNLNMIESKSQMKCKVCGFILSTLPSTECFFCKGFYHNQCIPEFAQNCFKFVESGNLYWCCSSCSRCKICYGIVDTNALQRPDDSQGLECKRCAGKYHFVCGAFIIPGYIQYECEECLKCDVCSRKLPILLESYIIKQSGVYCPDCVDFTGAEYCKICRKICSKDGRTQWSQCSGCSGWVHKECDQCLLNNFEYFQEHEYDCPICRNQVKRKHIRQILNIWMKFDQIGYFIEPTYEKFNDYSEIVSQPMCFKIMVEKCEKGLYDRNTKHVLIRDLNLIINNALKYNMPKDHCHFSARLLRVIYDNSLNYLQKFINLQELQLIKNKNLFKQLNQKQKQFYKYLYEHYLEMILNYGHKKSKIITVRPFGRQTSMPENFQFKSREFLNHFKNSSLIYSIPIQAPSIQHLFRLPATLKPSQQSLTKALCYYHNYHEIISTCQICCESFCCIQKCILHEICKTCGQKGCRCHSWGCMCKPGYTVKQLQHPALKFYNGNIKEITQMYKYCIKCSILNMKSRQCKYCQRVCSFDFIVCYLCSKRFHRKCTPKKTIIPSCCTQCEFLPENENKRVEILKQQAKRKIYKILRADKYLQIVMNIYLQQKINLQVHYIRKLIFYNYDKVQEYSEEIQNFISCYDRSCLQKYKEQKLMFLEMSLKENKQYFKAPLNQYEQIVCNNIFLVKEEVANNIYPMPGYQKFFRIYCPNLERNRPAHVKCNKIIEQYNLRKMYEQGSVKFQAPSQTFKFPKDKRFKVASFSSINEIIRILMQSNKIRLTLITELYHYVSPYMFSMGTQNFFYDPAIKQLNQLNRNIRNMFVSFYNQFKLFPRVGATSILEYKQNSIKIFKKWNNKDKGVMIWLRKDKGRKWKLDIDKHSTTIETFEELRMRLQLKFRSIRDSFQQIGSFLGFNINVKKISDFTYTKFLQTNSLDTQAFSQKQKKILQVYDRVKNNVVKKQDLFFLRKKPIKSQILKEKNIVAPYFTVQQLKKQTEDKPIIQKVNIKITEPTKDIFVAPSGIHKLGLFAKKKFIKHTLLIQYIGQLLSQAMADVRQQQFHLGCYMFSIPKKDQMVGGATFQSSPRNQDFIDQNTQHVSGKRDIVDATFKGNQARYLNHSCDPNCASKIEEINGKPRILMYALRDIQEYEQLTYDYQFKVSAADQKLICTCGSRNCQGSLN